MPLDADTQDLVGIALPPILGRKNFHVAMAGIAGVLHHGAQAAQLNDTVSRHAAIENEIAGGHEPIADVIGKNAPARARDLPRQIRVPPDVIDIDGEADALTEL